MALLSQLWGEDDRGGRTKATIENALKLVAALYEEHKDAEWVEKPISYALYYAWKRISDIEKTTP